MSIGIVAAALAVFAQAPPPPSGITVDAAKKTVLIKCKIAPRKLPNLPEIYPIEVVATYPTPKGQKAHETVVVFDVTPSEVHKALESLGLKPGKPGRGDDLCSGPELELLLDLPAAGNVPARQIRIESALVEKKTGRPLPPVKWHFTGSVMKEKAYGADTSGTLISLYPVTEEVVIQSGLTMKEEGLLKIETAKNVLPPEGTAVTLVIRPAAGPPPPPPPVPLDPERQVLKLSRTVGPGVLPPPTVGASAAAASGAPADPFEHRKEVRTGRSLPDSSRPIDLPRQ